MLESAENENKNRFEEQLEDEANPIPANPDYCNEKNEPIWDEGNDGFDLNKGIKWRTLPKGTRIQRYGTEYGTYAAPLHTPYSNLAMPYLIRSCQYNEYEVATEEGIDVCEIEIKEGTVAVQSHWPEEPGGGIQYYFVDKDNKKHRIMEYLKNKSLRRLGVKEWSLIPKEDYSHV